MEEIKAWKEQCLNANTISIEDPEKLKENLKEEQQRNWVQSSFSRSRVSNDNPYSESLFKTMKYKPQFPFKGFISIEESRKWVDQFVK